MYIRVFIVSLDIHMPPEKVFRVFVWGPDTEPQEVVGCLRYMVYIEVYIDPQETLEHFHVLRYLHSWTPKESWLTLGLVY